MAFSTPKGPVYVQVEALTRAIYKAKTILKSVEAGDILYSN